MTFRSRCIAFAAVSALAHAGAVRAQSAFVAGALRPAGARPHVLVTRLVPACPQDCYLGLQGTTANSGQKLLTAISQFTLDKTGKNSRLYAYYRPDTFRALGAAAANKQ